MNRRLLLLLKIIFTLLTLGLVVYEIDLRQLASQVRIFPIGWLIAGMAALTLAQLLSALRLRYYLSTVNIILPRKRALHLYFLGMFFNNLLPGGIGGDGYIVYLLHKHYQLRALTGARLMLATRANGLLLLCLFALGLAYYVPQLALPVWLPLVLAIATIAGYRVAGHWLLKEPVAISLHAGLYSAAVQAFTLFAALLLLQGVSVPADTLPAYLCLFMISAIVAIAPISVGGLGVREFTFLYGTKWLGLPVETGIAFSVIYYAMNLLCSLPGLYCFYRLPAGERNNRTPSS